MHTEAAAYFVRLRVTKFEAVVSTGVCQTSAMHFRTPIVSLIVFISGLITSWAAHPFLCCDYNGGKVCVVNAEGFIEWEFPAKSPQDCWLMPNGNYLFAYVGGAMEVNREKQIVWEYTSPE